MTMVAQQVAEADAAKVRAADWEHPLACLVLTVFIGVRLMNAYFTATLWQSTPLCFYFHFSCKDQEG